MVSAITAMWAGGCIASAMGGCIVVGLASTRRPSLLFQAKMTEIDPSPDRATSSTIGRGIYFGHFRLKK
jgi:hypothetical protein